jgi:hypothetical protein
VDVDDGLTAPVGDVHAGELPVEGPGLGRRHPVHGVDETAAGLVVDDRVVDLP